MDALAHCIRLEDVLKRNAGTRYYQVPGAGPHHKMYAVGTKVSLLTSHALIQWTLVLHGSGWMLGGKIKLEDIYICPVTGHLKLHFGKMKDLKELDKKGQSQRPDICAVADIIEVKIFKSGPIPFDMVHLLDLLKNYKAENEVLVLNHPGLKDEIQKVQMFGSSYKRLKQVYDLYEDKFNRICEMMPYCHLGEGHWKFKALENEHVKGILEHDNSMAKLNCKLAWAQKKIEALEQGKTEIYEALKREGPEDHGHRTVTVCIDPYDAQKMTVAMTLHPHFHFMLDTDTTERIAKASKSSNIDISTISADEALKAFYKFILDRLGFNHFPHDGNGLLKLIRHSDQHIIDSSVTCPEPDEYGYMPPREEKFSTSELEHIFGWTYPAIISHFVTAMAKEEELVNSVSVAISLAELIQDNDITKEEEENTDAQNRNE